jgi:hypothetical protein
MLTMYATLWCTCLVVPPSVLKVELSSLGSLKTLPYIVMFLMSNVGGLAGDRLIQRSKYSVAAARKTVNTIGGSGNQRGGRHQGIC